MLRNPHADLVRRVSIFHAPGFALIRVGLSPLSEEHYTVQA
jgi:hypothetical protein